MSLFYLHSRKRTRPWTSLYSMSRVLQPIRGVWSPGASLISPAVTPVHHFADTLFPEGSISAPPQKCLWSKDIVIVEIAQRNSIKNTECLGVTGALACLVMFLFLRRPKVQLMKFGYGVALTRHGASTNADLCNSRLPPTRWTFLKGPLLNWNIGTRLHIPSAAANFAPFPPFPWNTKF